MNEKNIDLQQLRNRYEGEAIKGNVRFYEVDSIAKIELDDYLLYSGILYSCPLLCANPKLEFWLEYFKKGDPKKSGSRLLVRIPYDELPIGANIRRKPESLEAQIYLAGKNEVVLNFYSRSIHNFLNMYFVSLCPFTDKLNIQELVGGER